MRRSFTVCLLPDCAVYLLQALAVCCVFPIAYFLLVCIMAPVDILQAFDNAAVAAGSAAADCETVVLTTILGGFDVLRQPLPSAQARACLSPGACMGACTPPFFLHVAYSMIHY